MKTIVNKPVEVEIERVVITLPVRYGTEDMPADFPGREGDEWQAVVMVDTGQILGWPSDHALPAEEEDGSFRLYMKVVDEGIYQLYSPDLDQVAAIKDDYVPHGLVPGDYGDYVDLVIGTDGIIKNWPASPSVAEFFPTPQDD